MESVLLGGLVRRWVEAVEADTHRDPWRDS